MAKSLAFLLVVLGLLGVASSAAVVVVAAAKKEGPEEVPTGKAKVLAKGTVVAVKKTPAVAVVPATTKPAVKPLAPGACPPPLSECDLSYGPGVIQGSIVASNENRILTNRQVYTKQGRPVTSIASGDCVVLGEPAVKCLSFGYMAPVAGSNSTTALGIYPVSQMVAQSLTGKCIKLGINNFSFDGKWVNTGDNNPAFPADRRCILIQT